MGIRPIVSSCNSITENISEFVDIWLQPLMRDLPSFIKDSIQLHPTYLPTSKICRVELCTELFYAIIPTFPCFLLICYPYILLDFNVFYSCSCHFFSSRCMLELKFAIYCRAATPPSHASYAVLAEESQAFFKHSPHTNSISNSAILHNYISLLSDLCACVHVKKKWRRKGSHCSSVGGSNRLE